MYARVCVSVHFAAAAAAVVCIESASENIVQKLFLLSCVCTRGEISRDAVDLLADIGILVQCRGPARRTISYTYIISLYV